MRILPAPLSVTLPPPSITVLRWVFTTLAVALIVIVTGFLPQLKVITPPLATARTTAADVQLRGEPLPITRFGCDVFTARAAVGTGAWPAGLPYRVSGRAVTRAPVVAAVVARAEVPAWLTAAPHATSARPTPRMTSNRLKSPRGRMDQHASPDALIRLCSRKSGRPEI